MKKTAKILLFIIMCFLMGCAEGNESDKNIAPTTLKENEYRIYCLNKEGTKLQYHVREAVSDTPTELIKELFSYLSENTNDLESQAAVEKDVILQSVRIVRERLYIYFSKEYYNIEPLKEVLVRAAIVKTLSQVSGVSKIKFYIDGNEQKTASGALVGVMTAADFVDDTTDLVRDNNVTNIILYFTDEKGLKLYPEVREVYIDSRSSKEKIVLDELLNGPKSANLRKVLPDGLAIISIVTRDGICYLDMDDTFLTGNINVVDTIPVYAIVNSLTAISGVEEVQIMINGEIGKTYRGVISFDVPLTGRKDLLADSE